MEKWRVLWRFEVYIDLLISLLSIYLVDYRRTRSCHSLSTVLHKPRFVLYYCLRYPTESIHPHTAYFLILFLTVMIKGPTDSLTLLVMTQSFLLLLTCKLLLHPLKSLSQNFYNWNSSDELYVSLYNPYRNLHTNHKSPLLKNYSDLFIKTQLVGLSTIKTRYFDCLYDSFPSTV